MFFFLKVLQIFNISFEILSFFLIAIAVICMSLNLFGVSILIDLNVFSDEQRKYFVITLKNLYIKKLNLPLKVMITMKVTDIYKVQ